MPSKFLNISTDNTLGGSSPSNEVVSSQKAVKEYVDNNTAPAGNYVTTDTVQTITEAKTFTKAVHFTGTGDTNAVFITENTRFDIESTTRTILGMANGQFYINHSSYALLLRGKNARPSYNSATSYLALLSDLDGYVPNTRTVNGKALSSDISLTAPDVGALPDSTVIPTVNNPTIIITQGGVTKGSFTLNQSSGDTIDLDAGGGGSIKTFDLFDHKWSDYQLNDQNWLRADTFSWQDGTVYSDAYDHLVDDIDGKTATSETIGSYTISYYLADDGHKITTDETTVANIYAESGVAWYYILDTTNQRFKLPRTKYGFVGLRDTVGNYVPESLPNITGQGLQGYEGSTSAFSGAISGEYMNNYGGYSSGSPRYRLLFDASNSSSVYQNGAHVQQSSTQMYLYFYVGQYSQTATEQTAGLNSELFNGKADVDLSNAASNASQTAKQTIVGWGKPDLSSVVSKSDNTDYTADTNGWLEIFTSCWNSNTPCYLYLNGVQRIINVASTSSHLNNNYCWIPVSKGVTYKVTLQRTGVGQYINFYPCIGE